MDENKDFNKRYCKSLLIIILALTYVCGISYYSMYNRLLKDGGDAWGYYIYLPSVFISKDIRQLEYVTEKREAFSSHTINPHFNHLGFDEVYIAPNGNPVIKYTSGVAIMLSPFFLIAHAIATWSEGIPNDGFQPIYWISVYLGVMFWVLLGISLLFRVLQKYLDETISFWTLLLIGIGTNLFYFTVYNSTMSHAPLFALYCILIYFSDSFWSRPSVGKAFMIGLLCGLITMIRPVELICLIIPIFWNINSISARFSFLKNHFWLLLWAVSAFAIAVFPQLLYWKTVTGSWLYYSYGSEGFDFLSPKIWKGLTGYQNGWLVYTPIMFFAVLGIYVMLKQKQKLVVPILLVIPIHIYIVYSWHNWYYINSFGSRPMVEMYALLAIPFGYFLNFMKQKRAIVPAIFIGILLLLLNQFQTWQVSRGMMLSEEGNKAYYWALFGRTSMNEKINTASDTGERQPTKSKISFVSELWYMEPSTDEEVLIPAYTGQGPTVSISCENLNPGEYLRISIVAKTGGWDGDRWNMSFINSHFKTKAGKEYRNRRLKINNKISNPTWNLWGGEPHVWQEVKYFIKVPSAVKPDDTFNVSIVNNGSIDLWIKDFKVELWR